MPASTLFHPVLSPKDPVPDADDNLPHVLLMLDQFPKALGGGERVALRMASLLPAQGFRVSILTFSIHPESELWSLVIPCRIYLLPIARTYDVSALRAASVLGRFLNQQKICLVQTFFESSDLWGGAVTRLLSSARLIWSRRDMGILRGYKHQIAYRLMSSLPHRVFAVSEQVRRHAIEVDHVHPAKVQVVYNGLDITPFASLSAPREVAQKGFRIATLGNIRSVKGHDLLISAAASVLQCFPHTSFWLAGEVLDPDYFSALKQQIAATGVADHIHFVHGVSEPAHFLKAADLFVLPSRSEGFSNAILEAMAAALPVVATDVGGNSEAVDHGKTGLIIPAGDSSALASAIISLLREPATLKLMGIAGSMRVSEHFTIQTMMQTVTQAYRDLLHHS